jgi:hypothetical protein
MKRLIVAAAVTMFAIGAAHAGSSISLHHADTIASQSAEGCMLGRSAASVDSCAASALSHSNSTHR